MKIISSEIHCWWCPLDEHPDSLLQNRCLAVLSLDEVKEYRSFHFQKDRDIYLISHGFLRSVLSLYLSCSPSAIQFTRDSFGKPHLRSGDLQFNLSHCKGSALLGISSASQAIGVDTEHCKEIEDIPAIVSHYFSAPEIKQLLKAPQLEMQQQFYQLWTLKEAYIKAIGKGLSIPLNEFAFDIWKKPLGFSVLNGETNADEWSYWQLQFRDTELNAIGVYHPRQEKVRKLCVYRTQPFSYITALDLNACVSNTF
jgi:4'-phosphopantetheinyl transferase